MPNYRKNEGVSEIEKGFRSGVMVVLLQGCFTTCNSLNKKKFSVVRNSVTSISIFLIRDKFSFLSIINLLFLI